MTRDGGFSLLFAIKTTKTLFKSIVEYFSNQIVVKVRNLWGQYKRIKKRDRKQLQSVL